MPRGRRTSPTPPGQRVVARMPVQYIGDIVGFERATWRLVLEGLVAAPRSWTLPEVEELSTTVLEADFHAGSGWSVLGVEWLGIRLADVLALAKPLPEARFVRFGDGERYEATLSLADATAPDVLLATRLNGAPLTAEHGAPLRLVAPGKYGRKSVKWLRRIEVRGDDAPGFWEQRGMHAGADPWREERYA